MYLQKTFLLIYLYLFSEIRLIKTLADQISVYSKFYYTLDKNPGFFSNTEEFNYQYSRYLHVQKLTCLQIEKQPLSKGF